MDLPSGTDTVQDAQGRKRSAEDEPKPSKRPVVSISTWLSSSTGNADANALPAPVTCEEAYIEDRNSVFIGYAMRLTTASPTYIAALLDNLTHVIHPAIPITKLPSQFRHSAPSKRGSTHDMYAFRVLQLKPGRSGLRGPSDFGIEQGKEDDGETWGADKIMRVIRELGASDVLVVVSRWYGGQFLGPVRFEHITNAARAALQAYLMEEQINELKVKLRALDKKIAGARRIPYKENAYNGLKIEQAKRLLVARTKTFDIVLAQQDSIDKR
ncbi:Similar to S.cerevisiae protein YIH1 (Negative regulator of eIF2 kinase Gcn2p) [Malassezia sympodialis ATCC 42132]|uniref:Similar to S.cerevisiae protein YIH1 (Negative regulator of eIF2 kinase Gcn2p) n=1 Tax=Malassezia sympodialis (strain ATCC 42132) TaxID=1230383 RepID=A0A1M8AAF5_MALS4|nr:Similar to S.cerevisiae protein YIH1 (Negative regulator of eIF2 kinase Gcn2p) [Malassezia sympodialis ATCC 42132]